MNGTLTVPQVAHRLRLSKQTVRKILQQGILKGFKTGRGNKTHWRVTQEALEEFVNAGSGADTEQNKRGS